MIAVRSELWRDRVAFWLAYRLPRRVVYMATIRLWAEVTSGKQYGRTLPAHLRVADALERFQRNHVRGARS